VIFGETESWFQPFYNSSNWGRITLPEWLGVDTGTVVLVTAVGAILLIWGSEYLERAFRKEPRAAPAASRWRFAGAGVLAVAALGVMLVGQPTVARLWQRVAAEKSTLLADRKVQIQPAELRSLYYNPLVNLVMIDVRDESDYNLFHLKDAQRVPPEKLAGHMTEWLALPEETVFVLMSNDEARATAAWKTLAALDLRNVYILEGGINEWLAVYGVGQFTPVAAGDERLRYHFSAALGDRGPAAVPSQHEDGIEYIPKVQMMKKAPTGGGGCG
jgi:rhodanese-related sulfurtransferase